MKTRTILLCLLFLQFEVFAQKTVVFKGKTYLEYPYDITNSRLEKIEFDFQTLKFSEMLLPPVIGTLKDGEYVIHRNDLNYEYTSKGTTKVQVRNVYATITIINNKKEGLATFYAIYEQERPYMEVPYSNDQINGQFDIKIGNAHSYRTSFNSEYFGYYGLASLNYTFGERALYKLNFKEGIPNGVQSYYILYGKNGEKRDSLLANQVSVENGVLNGPYIMRWYGNEIVKKKGFSAILNKDHKKFMIKEGVVLKSEFSGVKINGKATGNWVFKDFESGSYSVYNYDNEMLVGLQQYRYGKLLYTVYYSLDSIKKYVPDYKQLPLLPDYQQFSYTSNQNAIHNYLVIKENDNNVRSYHFKLRDSASANFYRRFDNYSDTIINGHFVLVETFNDSSSDRNYENYLEKNKKARSCKIYTSFNFNSILRKYDEELVMVELFDKKGKFLERMISPNSKVYDTSNHIVSDSLRPILMSCKVEGLDTIKRFCLYPDASVNGRYPYVFDEFYLHSGSNLTCRKQYEINGIADSLEVMSRMIIIKDGHVLTLIDTIYHNGRYMYAIDTLFALMVREDIKSSLLSDSLEPSLYNFYLTHLINFFMPLPEMHRAVLVDNNQFSGFIHVSMIENAMKKIEERVDMQFKYVINSNTIDLVLNFNRNKSKYHKKIQQRYIGLMSAYFIGSNFNGMLNYKGAMFNVGFHGFYYKNKLGGQINLNHALALNKETDLSGYSNLERSHAEIDHEKLEVYELNIYLGNLKADYPRYFKGKPHGQWQITMSNFRIAYQLNFEEGCLNGNQYAFNKNPGSQGSIEYILPMRKDQLDGQFYKLSGNGIPVQSGQFSNGVPNGWFYEYNPSDTSDGKFIRKFYIDKGYLSGDLIVNDYSGENIRYKISIDSKDSILAGGHLNVWYRNEVFSDIKYFEDRMQFEKINWIFAFYNLKRAYYTYYYTQGAVFSKGYKIYGNTKGKWEFYREDGSIYKQVHFKDSSWQLKDGSLMRTYGKVNAYYPNGQLMFTGFDLNNKVKLSCENAGEMPVEDDYYISFYDSTGKSLLQGDSGYVVEYQSNGLKLKEGKVLNGQMHGVWTFYDKYGQKTEFGNYVNGRREGRWLSGDLDGLHLSENMCFMEPKDFEEWINTYGRNLKLTEIYYKNGKEINKIEIQIESNK